MRLIVYVLGPAGSGKSTFSASFSEWLINESGSSLLVNLDPAAIYLPYTPDVDVRVYVDASSVMEKYNLGPNGAIIASVDLMLSHLDKLKDEINEFDDGYVLIDTPGQMEVFAFRRTGEAIVKNLCGERCVIVFLVDAVLANRPSGLLSQLFLAASIYYRFKLPLYLLLNKIDLLSSIDIENVTKWIEDPQNLKEDLEKELEGSERILSRDLAVVLEDFLNYFTIIPASSKKMEGFDRVYIELQKFYSGGEDFEMPDYLRRSLEY